MFRKLRFVRMSWVKLVVLLVLLLALMQILHVMLLSRLEVLNTARKRAQSMRRLQDQTVQLFHSMKAVIESSQILDSSGEYTIVTNVYQGDGDGGAIRTSANKGGGGGGVEGKQRAWQRQQDVTLVSQCSINHIHHIAHLSKRWSGPVSVAIFASIPEVSTAIELLMWLYQCVPSMRHNVSIHLVKPFSHIPPVIPSEPPKQGSFTCGNLAENFHKHLSQSHNYPLEDILYPNNLLRNVAITAMSSEYIFVVDIDMLPNAALHADFTNFLRQKAMTNDTSRMFRVYVVPAFEIQPHLALPQDKEQLLILWKQSKLRPFYSELCWMCQKPTDYNAWQHLRPGTSAEATSAKVACVGVGYEVAWVDPWEPFFIAPRIAPLYDERFKQYGFNRISQVCELHVAGFRFHVLDTAFLVHKGFKTMDSFHLNKELEQNQNRLLFRKFKEELKTKYPESQHSANSLSLMNVYFI